MVFLLLRANRIYCTPNTKGIREYYCLYGNDLPIATGVLQVKRLLSLKATQIQSSSLNISKTVKTVRMTTQDFHGVEQDL